MAKITAQSHGGFVVSVDKCHHTAWEVTEDGEVIALFVGPDKVFDAVLFAKYKDLQGDVYVAT